MAKVTLDDVISNILAEQEDLKQKKTEIKQLISYLSSNIESQSKSYRSRSTHLIAETIKALVSAHNIDIQLSSTLLRSYDQLAKLLKEMEMQSQNQVDATFLENLIGILNQDIEVQNG